MTMVSKKRFGFTSVPLKKHREPHPFHYLSERSTFWVAVVSLVMFVTGNMVGTHGWRVFWKSVLGEGEEQSIVFTGTVPPIERVPDFERWSRVGGDVRAHTYRQVPQDLLVPLPEYKRHAAGGGDEALKRVYFVEHLGTYNDGRGQGSHPGVDIVAPEGTPVRAVANGLVADVDDDAGGFGTYIVIKHPNVPDPRHPGSTTTLYSIYAHLSAAIAEKGAVVKKGEQIALTGQTGFATAPHLHFQMDAATAPWHPYWLFTSSEARLAGLTFTQAVDRGLYRERGLEHTVDSMLFVQAYQTVTGPFLADAGGHADSSSSSVRSRAARAMTVAERRAARLAKRPTSTTLVAFTDNAPIVPIPPASSSTPAVAAPAAGTIVSIRIAHDGTFTRARGWERVTLTLLDPQERVVTAPGDTGKKFAVRTAYGRAEFTKPVLTIDDFRRGRGVVTLEMLPLGEQTVVIQVDGSLSQPMRYVR